MSRLPYLWILCLCLLITGCATNAVSPQTGALPESYERPKLTQVEVFIADLTRGSAFEVTWDKIGAHQTVAIHNGSNVAVELQADASVTGVTLLGSALSPIMLHRTLNGRWRGAFQYWDLSNVVNSTTTLTLQLLSAKGSSEKTIFITTLHDS